MSKILIYDTTKLFNSNKDIEKEVDEMAERIKSELAKYRSVFQNNMILSIEDVTRNLGQPGLLGDVFEGYEKMILKSFNEWLKEAIMYAKDNVIDDDTANRYEDQLLKNDGVIPELEHDKIVEDQMPSLLDEYEHNLRDDIMNDPDPLDLL